jgi:hypothetical protein
MRGAEPRLGLQLVVGWAAAWAHQLRYRLVVGSSMMFCWAWAAAGRATPSSGARQVGSGQWGCGWWVAALAAGWRRCAPLVCGGLHAGGVVRWAAGHGAGLVGCETTGDPLGASIRCFTDTDRHTHNPRAHAHKPTRNQPRDGGAQRPPTAVGAVRAAGCRAAAGHRRAPQQCGEKQPAPRLQLSPRAAQ